MSTTFFFRVDGRRQPEPHAAEAGRAQLTGEAGEEGLQKLSRRRLRRVHPAGTEQARIKEANIEPGERRPAVVAGARERPLRSAEQRLRPRPPAGEGGDAAAKPGDLRQLLAVGGAL